LRHREIFKLQLMNVHTGLYTLLDKLKKSQFNIWWSSIRTKQGETDLTIDESTLPWSVRWLLSEGYKISDNYSEMRWKYFVDMKTFYTMR